MIVIVFVLKHVAMLYVLPGVSLEATAAPGPHAGIGAHDILPPAPPASGSMPNRERKLCAWSSWIAMAKLLRLKKAIRTTARK